MSTKNPIRDIMVRCCTDKTFRDEFTADPAAVLARMGIKVPAGKTIRVLESSDEEMIVVLPSSADDQPANWEQKERPEPGEKRSVGKLEMEWDENGLTLCGRVDSESALGLKEELDRNSGNLVLDLSEVNFLSSAGIGVLVSVHKRLSEMGKELSLYNVSAEIQNVFALSGLDNLFVFISAADDMYLPYGFGMI